MTREEAKDMVREWIVTNKRPMTAGDAETLASVDGYCSLDALLWIRDAAHYFATDQDEEQFKAQNNFDQKFNVRWMHTDRHGSMPYLCEL